MSSKKRLSKDNNESEEDVTIMKKKKTSNVCALHTFSDEEVRIIRINLLSWYYKNKRSLPWRDNDTGDVNEKAYTVWISEVMLQQTQVPTVIDYYTRWMTKWPTLQDLANSSLGDVNKAWTGLGFYGRAKHLYEGATKIMDELNGVIPCTADELAKKIPGIGRYTASAIASIAFNEVTGVVDGNVMRFLTRMRCIASDVAVTSTMELLWRNSQKLVDPDLPGDFNQAMMELGSLICTPNNPKCTQCPVQKQCYAYQQIDRKGVNSLPAKVGKKKAVQDIENVPECTYCWPKSEPFEESGPANYPKRVHKVKVRFEESNVYLITRKDPISPSQEEFFIVQRPTTGLLAEMWEFPSILRKNTGDKTVDFVTKSLDSDFGISPALGKKCRIFGTVKHTFSHIKAMYHIFSLQLLDNEANVKLHHPRNYQDSHWIREEDVLLSALPSAMKKIFQNYIGWRTDERGGEVVVHKTPRKGRQPKKPATPAPAAKKTSAKQQATKGGKKEMAKAGGKRKR